jgi:hypothetical protein
MILYEALTNAARYADSSNNLVVAHKALSKVLKNVENTENPTIEDNVVQEELKSILNKINEIDIILSAQFLAKNQN